MNGDGGSGSTPGRTAAQVVHVVGGLLWIAWLSGIVYVIGGGLAALVGGGCSLGLWVVAFGRLGDPAERSPGAVLVLWWLGTLIAPAALAYIGLTRGRTAA